MHEEEEEDDLFLPQSSSAVSANPASHASSSSTSHTPAIRPSTFNPAHRTRRVIMHVDMDCFYAQVDRERFPHWRYHPIAVVQNGTLVVTSNYRVRARGLPKMGDPKPMLAGCPTKMKFAGSDMVRYRAASKAWYNLFQSFSPTRITVMKKSIDESYLDLTEEALHRIREGKVGQLKLVSPELRQFRRARAAERFARAEDAWKKADNAMRALGVAEQDLESTGNLRAAVYFSKSTDPITELRRKAQEELGRPIREPQLPPPPPVPDHLKGLTEEQIESHCNTIHPIDFCRADKRLPESTLVPVSEVVPPEVQLPVDPMKENWRRYFVGYVFLDGTDPKDRQRDSSAAVTMEDATLQNDDIILPPQDFADEDPNNPSYDYLMAVGSQIAFEIRERLHAEIGFTTSSGIAPNCMLAKLASSLNKPNQQSIIRSNIAPAFLRNIKLESISGFGPKACEVVSEHNLVTVGDVQRLSYPTLSKLFPSKFAQYLWDISTGVDETPVNVHLAPKSIGQSKQQRTKNTEERLALLAWLSEKLWERMQDDEKEYSRHASSFSFYWIDAAKTTWGGVSRRCPLPASVYREKPRQSDNAPPWIDLYELSIKMCKLHVPEAMTLRCLSLGVSQFVPVQAGKGMEGFLKNVTTPNLTATLSSGSSSVSPPVATQVHQESQSNTIAVKRSQPTLAAHLVPASILSSTSATPSPAPEDPIDAAFAMPSLEVAPVLAPMLDLDRIESDKQRRMQLQMEEERDEKARHQQSHMEIADEKQIDDMFGATGEASDTAKLPAPSAPSATAPSCQPDPPNGEWRVCGECNQRVRESEWVEHSDFHFAASFQAKIRETDRIEREKQFAAQAAAAAAASSSNAAKKRKGNSVASASSGSSKMSLDRFVVAAPSPAAAGSSNSKPGTPASKRTPPVPSSSSSNATLNSFFKPKNLDLK